MNEAQQETVSKANEDQPQGANESQQEATDEKETAGKEPAKHEDRHRTRIFDYAEAERVEEEERARMRAERTAFLQKLMGGPDVMSWVVPTDGVVADDVLRQHMAQLQNVVRYALQYAVADREPLQLKLSAAATATSMIRAHIALAKALSASDSKTVRGARRRRGPQD